MIPVRDDNPAHIRPYVTWALILACALIYGWQIWGGETHLAASFSGLGMTPQILTGLAATGSPQPWVPGWMTVFTSMFLHGSLAHLLGNLLFLWVFGNNIEDAMGHLRFSLFYLACGLAAVAAQVLPEPASAVPMVGASGAISGVLGAYLLLYPRARILIALPPPLIFVTIGWFRAIWVLTIWFLLQLVMSIGFGIASSGVAFMAHVGGFVAGLALIPLFKFAHVPLWRSH
ncbi:MAG: rhomboid family intramembrane serine protease [Gammaproteobacteria bacterium]|nr:rhomboid family intramembrane serine protease [Gammaproteobacteria bacterium]